jgi:hypothetical protein
MAMTVGLIFISSPLNPEQPGKTAEKKTAWWIALKAPVRAKRGLRSIRRDLTGAPATAGKHRYFLEFFQSYRMAPLAGIPKGENTVKAHFRVLTMIGVACFILGAGAVWVGRLTANAANPQATAAAPAADTDTTPDSMSEKNDAHIKIADRTKSYLASVTTKNALKVDGSGANQPVIILTGTPVAPATSPAPVSNSNPLPVVIAGGTGLRGSLPENTVSPDLGYPAHLTMCWDADQVTVMESVDGTTWFPSLNTQAAKDTGIMAVGIGCMSVPPARFVKWTSQDYQFSAAAGMFQASY